MVTPTPTPTNKRPRPQEEDLSKNKKVAHEEDLESDFRKLKPVLEVLEQEIRSLLENGKTQRIGEEELRERLGRTLLHAESAVRKSTRLEESIMSCAYLYADNEELNNSLEGKEAEINELKRRADNADIPRGELLRLLDEGVADEMWNRLVRQPWPGEGFKATKVITREDYEGTSNMVIVISDDDTEGTSQVKGLNLSRGAKAAIESDELTSGNFAKIVSTEMTHVDGKELRADTVTYVVKVGYDAERMEESTGAMIEAMRKVFVDMPQSEFVCCSRLRGLQSEIRKVVELQGRKSKHTNAVWFGRKKRKETNNKEQEEEVAIPTPKPRQRIGQHEQVPSFANVARKPGTEKEEYPPLGSRSRIGNVGKRQAGNRVEEPKKAQPPKRPTVVVSAGGRSYGEIVKAVRGCVGTLGAKIVDARMIKGTEEAQYQLMVNNMEDASKIRDKLTEARFVATSREPLVRLVIAGIDESLTEQEIREELALSGLESRNIRAFPPNKWGKKLVFCEVVDGKKSREVLKKGRVSIGYTSCTIRLYVGSNICYRCHEEGHYQRECKSAQDYSKCCRLCKEEGHFAANCTRDRNPNQPGNIEGEAVIQVIQIDG